MSIICSHSSPDRHFAKSATLAVCAGTLAVITGFILMMTLDTALG